MRVYRHHDVPCNVGAQEETGADNEHNPHHVSKLERDARTRDGDDPVSPLLEGGRGRARGQGWRRTSAHGSECTGSRLPRLAHRGRR